MRSPRSLLHRETMRALWSSHRQAWTYLIVGAWNSFFTYACFAILYFCLSDRLFPSIILAITYLLASVNGFVAFRHVVFGPVRHPLAEWARFEAVYLPIQIVNLVVLPLAIAFTPLNAYVTQALFAVFPVIAGYLGNKHFVFRPRSDSAPEDDPG
jgi:putative flippase GtrA